MNERARNLLRQAALDGVRQIRLRPYDGRGGLCAIAVLIREAELCDLGIDEDRSYRCPHPGCPKTGGEVGIIVHLNDYHGDDFLTIANKEIPRA